MYFSTQDLTVKYIIGLSTCFIFCSFFFSSTILSSYSITFLFFSIIINSNIIASNTINIIKIFFKIFKLYSPLSIISYNFHLKLSLYMHLLFLPKLFATIYMLPNFLLSQILFLILHHPLVQH